MSITLKPFELTITILKVSGLIVPQARNVKIEWVDDKGVVERTGYRRVESDGTVEFLGVKLSSSVPLQWDALTNEYKSTKITLNIRGSERVRKIYALHRRSEYEKVLPLVDYDPLVASKLREEGFFDSEPENSVQESTSSSLQKTSSSEEQTLGNNQFTAWPSALIGTSEDSDFVIGKAELEATIFLDTENTHRGNSMVCHKKLEISVLGDSGIRVATIYTETRASFIPDTSFSCRDLFSTIPNGEYLLRIMVHEVRDMLSMHRRGGTTDPYVQITTFGQTLRTQRALNTVNAVFHRLLYFSAYLKGWELEREALNVQVFDWNRIRKNVLIGVHEMDLKYIYDQPNHRVKEKWFPLYSSYGKRVEKITRSSIGLSTVGYVKLSITLIPPGSVPVHRNDYYEFEEMSGRQLLNKLVLRRPPLVPEPWNLFICVYRAEMLPRMAPKGEEDIIRAFATCFYGGYKAVTTSTKKSLKSIEKAGFALSGSVVKQLQKNLTKTASHVFRNATFGSVKRKKALKRGLFPSRGRWVEWNEMIRVPVAIVDGEVSQDLIKVELYHTRESFLGMNSSEGDLIGWLQFRFSDILAHRERVKVHYLTSEPEKEDDESFKKATLFLREREKREAEPPHFYERLLSVENQVNKLLFGRDNTSDENLENEFIERVYQLEPRWYNLYGPSRGPTDYGKKNASFRGRALISIHTSRSLGTLPPARLYIPPELCIEPDTSRYQLDYSIYQVCEVPLESEHYLVSFDVQLGTFCFGEQTPPQPVNHRSVIWENGQGTHGSFSDLELPSRFSDIPDLFVNLYAHQKRHNSTKKTRFAYLRLSAKYVRQCTRYPRWLLLDTAASSLFSFYEVPGNLLLSLSLTATEDRVSSMTVESSSQSVSFHPSDTMLPMNSFEFILRCYILEGRNLPAADEGGLANPFFVVRCGEYSAQSNTICYGTLFPQWFECVTLQIPVTATRMLSDIFVMVYEHSRAKKKKLEQSPLQPSKCLGRVVISGAQVKRSQPTLPIGKWYPLFQVNPEIMAGEILAEFHLLPKEQEESLPVLNLEPRRFRACLKLSIIGALDVEYKNKTVRKASVSLRLQSGSQDQHYETSPQPTNFCLNGDSFDVFFRDVIFLPLELPEQDVVLTPTMQIQVFDHERGEVVGTCDLALDDYEAVFLQKLRASESTQTRLNSFLQSSYFRRLSSKYFMSSIDAENASILSELLSDESCGVDFASTLESVHQECGRSAQHGNSVPRGHFISISHPKYDMLQIGDGREELQDIVEESVIVGGSEDVRRRALFIRQVFNTFQSLVEGLQIIVTLLKDIVVEYVPDLALRLHIEEEKLPSFFYPDSSELNQVGNLGSSLHCRIRRGFCPVELEEDFCHARYAELFLTRGRLTDIYHEEIIKATEENFEDSFLTKEQKKAIGIVSKSAKGAVQTTVKHAKKPMSIARNVKDFNKDKLFNGNAGYLGKNIQPIYGRLKLEAEILSHQVLEDDVESKRQREGETIRWKEIYREQNVVVRLYVLHGWNLRCSEGYANAYLKVSCSHSEERVYSTKSHPVSGTLHPKFFDTFQFKCKVPYSILRIKVKNYRAPEFDIPLAGGFGLKESWNLGVFSHKRLAYSVNVDTKRIPGLRKSEFIGETYIDLSHRWYNPAWRLLARKPVEIRSLWNPNSTTPTGRLECFVDILTEDAARHMVPENIMPEPPKQFEVRLVIWGVQGCFLPISKAQQVNNEMPTPDLSVSAEFGLDHSTSLHTDVHPRSDDGCGEFNYRMVWTTGFPEETSYRLRMTIWDVSSASTGSITDGTFIAECQLNIEPLLKEALVTGRIVSRKPQWLRFTHPNYPQLNAHAKLSLDVLEEHDAKLYPVGRGRQEPNQYPFLPPPFRPVFLNPLNPMPFVWYQVYKYIYYYFWTVVSYLAMTPLALLGFKVLASCWYLCLSTTWQI
ncbi:uncharacterized protein Gasu_36640 [Galdieria sulphuraria]|uniref:C2 domain-containing protein n=1 Tax=Galdieria sulphuraria TaxID=130081 RepID=M2XZ55_GALSU|nr:uncharacterized protein Gasu_36640 [Galdieria sulphuraria]EME28928.1 hypothetical protein Gasu_36640 [Galdieria sulphuraria]|eukprot:XP_005705448.1 hypothetical protein Gasu_36640 [Galdieria sulphuraria]